MLTATFFAGVAVFVVVGFIVETRKQNRPQAKLNK